MLLITGEFRGPSHQTKADDQRCLPQTTQLDLVSTCSPSRFPQNRIALRSSAILLVSGPTRLRLPDLLRITDQAAGEVLNDRLAESSPRNTAMSDNKPMTRFGVLVSEVVDV